MRLLLAILVLCCSTTTQAMCVILLHGLARSDGSMHKMEGALQDAGFSTVNIGYPSREYPIETLAEMAIEPALNKCAAGEEVSFVTHSLGGILVRQYLENKDINHLKYVVMLGPPKERMNKFLKSH